MPFSVLFVDDEAEVLKLFREVFKSLRPDWDTWFTASGEEAVARLATIPTDVLITDLNMPGMTGDELLERVGRDFPCMKRVMISGSDEPCAHADVVLRKPCRPMTVINALDQICAECQARV